MIVSLLILFQQYCILALLGSFRRKFNLVTSVVNEKAQNFPKTGPFVKKIVGEQIFSPLSHVSQSTQGEQFYENF
jgi:hypothetical protein